MRRGESLPMVAAAWCCASPGGRGGQTEGWQLQRAVWQRPGGVGAGEKGGGERKEGRRALKGRGAQGRGGGARAREWARGVVAGVGNVGSGRGLGKKPLTGGARGRRERRGREGARGPGRLGRSADWVGPVGSAPFFSFLFLFVSHI